MTSPPLPLRIVPPADPVEADIEPLFDETFASAWASDGCAHPTLRGRLLGRLAASRAASAAMVTSRLKRLATSALARGVAARTLYAAPQERPLRPGEPEHARLIELQPGSCWDGPGAGSQREWLLLRGAARIGDVVLERRDYHVEPMGQPRRAVVALAPGALLFLREAPLTGAAADPLLTVRDAEAGWPEFAPGIRRRVLWQRDGQAAMLYCAQAGAAVPQHAHGHDEECLMVQGELFLDDLLLQEGDYQLAPAGTWHRITETDTGGVIYAHGDLDLQFVG